MNRKNVPNLPHLPVMLPAMLPQFGNPLLIAEAVRGLGPKEIHPILPEAVYNPGSLVNISSELCKGCKLCIYACPTGNLSLSPELNRKGYHTILFSYNGTRGPCSACGLCYWICPDFAIGEIKKLRQ